MNIQELLIDFILDALDIISKHKKVFHLFLASLILGSATGFAAARVTPETPDSALLLASVIDAEQEEEKAIEKAKAAEMLKAAEEEKAEKKLEQTMSESFLQDIHTLVIAQEKPELCNEKLVGKYADYCINNYWNIQASLQNNIELCKNITEKTTQESCETAIKTNKDNNEDSSFTSMSDEEVTRKSEECLNIEGEKNQNVCWNSLFLSVALNNGDPSKCESIKDDATKANCTEQAKARADEVIKKRAVAQKNYERCKEITDSNIQQSCLDETMETILTVSESCTELCVNKKAEEFALDQVKIDICSKSTTPEARTSCRDSVYAAIAVKNSNTTYCDNIQDDAKKTACDSSVEESEDKNPEVQEYVFKKSDRNFPSIGTSLNNPLDEYPFASNESIQDVSEVSDFNSILDELQNFNSNTSKTESTNNVILTDVCKVYTNSKMKMACEDSLILQVAIPNKDVEKCSFIQDETTREYCELEIIQGDAIRAAEEAKRQCNALSTTTAQQKCLKTLGFFTEEVQAETSADCLDYSEPAERIACMRDLKSSEETTDETSFDEVESLDEIESLDEVEEIIEEALE